MSGPRHPGTEGNDLWPADVKFPDPDGGDGRLSLVNDVAAEFSGLAISSTQPTDMPDGGLWVNLSAEATAVDRLSTFDESTDAFIPIQADSTVVQDSEPAHSKGLIWFDSSPEDGFDMFFSDGETWHFLQFIPEIPDSVVNQHLKDDWTDTQWPDSVGDADLSVSNLSFDSQAFAGTGGVAASGDGYATGPAPTIDFTAPWSVSIPFETTDEGNEILVLSGGEQHNDSLRFALNGLSYISDVSNAGLAIRADGDDFVIIDTDQSFADGESHHMIITSASIAPNDIDIYIDDMQTAQSVTERDDNISINGSMVDLTYFARDSDPSRPITANLSNVRWAAKVLDSDERQQYQDDLPLDITD